MLVRQIILIMSVCVRISSSSYTKISKEFHIYGGLHHYFINLLFAFVFCCFYFPILFEFFYFI